MSRILGTYHQCHVFSCFFQKESKASPGSSGSYNCIFHLIYSPFLKKSALRSWRAENYSHRLSCILYVLCTDIRKAASVTVRFCPCRAYLASMIYQTMTEIAAFFRRYDLPESHLNLFGFFDSVHQTDAVTQTDTVCICHDCRFPENITHDQVCTLASDSRKLQKFLKSRRYIVCILFVQDTHTGTDIPRLAFTESARAHDCLDLLRLCCGK